MFMENVINFEIAHEDLNILNKNKINKIAQLESTIYKNNNVTSFLYQI